MNDASRAEAAAALARAERERAAIDPLTDTYEDIDVLDAYAIQQIQIADRVAAGASVVGHKVGLSSAAMQTMMGVDEPDYGHLLDDMFVFEADRIAMDELCQPRAEIELAFVLGEPIDGAHATVADVLRATAYVMPSIEVVDSRIVDWRIRIEDTIADNASSGRVVLAGNATRLADVDPRLIGAVLRRNGEIVETGATGAVLGNPVTAVAWLARKVHAHGVALQAGHVVLPGSCTRAVDVRAGDTIRADFDGIGHVSIRFE